ncbi:putative Lactate utilization protein B/C [Syntrophobacter sp. SbD1]|nr:putative Lactate utilization protein B/C [Syntrophobacter sp. SbD1]
MDKNRIQWNENVSQQIIQNLEKRRMEGSYAATAAQALEEVLSMIPHGATVYRCGSSTTTSMGLWNRIADIPNVKVIDPYRHGISHQESMAARHKGLGADIMIASCNAITLDGRLVNLDGLGNRVAAMMFGPAKVILVVGMNKVATDLDCAIARVKHFAAPINALRTGVETPCAASGLCTDCRSPERVCNLWSIIEGHRTRGRIHVKLVGEDLGY